MCSECDLHVMYLTGYVRLGVLQRNVGRYSEAVELLGQALELAAAGTGSCSSIDVKLVLADTHIRAGQPELAKKLLEKVLAQHSS